MPLQAALAPLARKIAAAFVYGSIAKGTDTAKSDVDLMVIADKLDYSDVFAVLKDAEMALARPVNPNLMTRAEWRRKRSQADSCSYWDRTMSSAELENLVKIGKLKREMVLLFLLPSGVQSSLSAGVFLYQSAFLGLTARPHSFFLALRWRPIVDRRG